MSNEEHEITVRITTDIKNLFSILENNGFKKFNNFILDDIYMISDKYGDIKKYNSKELINRTIRLRTFIFKDKKRIEIVKKEKIFDKNDNILSEKKYVCEVVNKQKAYEFLLSIGYIELFTMFQKVNKFTNGKNFLIVSEIDDRIYIEIEDKDNNGDIVYNSVEEMIDIIKKYNIPHDETNYFKQKAVDKLNEIRKENI